MMPSPIRAEYQRWASGEQRVGDRQAGDDQASRTTMPAAPRAAPVIALITSPASTGVATPMTAASDHGDQEDDDVAPVGPGERDDPPGGAALELVAGDLVLLRIERSMLQPPMPPPASAGHRSPPGRAQLGPSGQFSRRLRQPRAVTRFFPAGPYGYSPARPRSRSRRVCASRSARCCSAWVRPAGAGEQRLDLDHRVAGRRPAAAAVRSRPRRPARPAARQGGQPDPVGLGGVHPAAGGADLQRAGVADQLDQALGAGQVGDQARGSPRP